MPSLSVVELVNQGEDSVEIKTNEGAENSRDRRRPHTNGCLRKGGIHREYGGLRVFGDVALTADDQVIIYRSNP